MQKSVDRLECRAIYSPKPTFLKSSNVIQAMWVGENLHFLFVYVKPHVLRGAVIITFQKIFHNSLAVLCERIVAIAKAPIIHKTTLHDCIGFDYFVDGNIIAQLPAFLTIEYYLPEQLIIGSVLIEKMSISASYKLRGKKSRQEVNRNFIFYHKE